WTVKRLRLPHHLGHVLTDRLNVGVLAGAPLAFASYFLANRLFPPMSAHRADHEVQCVFIVWGLALVFALARPARRTWPEMLAACALACFGIALMSSPWTNPVTQSTALVSLFFSGAFGYAAFRALNGKAKQT
ncbi:peptidase, partial [Gluconobacter japonicus]